jgi:protein-S-isoprenylcysteine O-methyltransferase Ste14
VAQTGTPGTRRILPPVYFLAAIVLMAALDRWLPLARPFHPLLTYLGWLLLVLALAVAVAVAWRFKRAGTTIKPFQRSSALVTDGLFAYSRNPIYLGMVVGLLGIFLALGSLGPLLVVPPFVYIIQTRFIAVEERMLEDAFGEAYLDYCRRVRRWL